MGSEQQARFLSREQVRTLVVLAEQARRDLSQYAGYEVGYDVETLQLLDEWIDDTLERRPDPPRRTRFLWIGLLGEMFRRHHDGWWALRDSELIVVCPTGLGHRRHVLVEEQVKRRIRFAMSESLTHFYNITRIELKLS
jgi:hypothetical protein